MSIDISRWTGAAGYVAALVVLAAGLGGVARGDDVLVASGSVWRFLDDGADPGTGWRGVGFDDAAWLMGPAELGYGDGDEATVVGFGPNSASKFVTTYFRHAFSVPDASAYVSLGLRLKRDDGAVVHLNGLEVARSNMPAGTIAATTLAAAVVGGLDESTFLELVVPASVLVDGVNQLAVEVHQADPTSSDVSFDLELVANTSPLVVRGPYLQRATPTSIVVRWRTSVPTDSRVSHGPVPGAPDIEVDDPTLTTEHVVVVGDLSPATPRYYAVGSTTEVLAGGDAEHRLMPPPVPGTALPTRIWVVGDSGTADANARAVRDDFLAFNGGGAVDVWLMLGDNAYPNGTDARYQAAVFDTYPQVLTSSVLWPTPGNHDAEPNGVSMSSGVGPYFDMFTLPAGGEAGGLPSGTEAYYAFDHGNIHFVSLNSTGSDSAPGGAMLTWLAEDLAATDKDWIIAYWHHPPYTKGSHDSDDPLDSEGRLFDVRERLLPVLEAGGVDLVLTGHSHAYERSMLVDGHYGHSETLAPSMILDDGDGRTGGDGAYRKQPRGTVYVVAGSSGMVGGGSLDHPVMYLSLNALGSLVVDVDGGRLDARFLSGGAVRDAFTLVKGPECDVALSQDAYVVGESLVVSRMVVRNRGPNAVRVALRAWLDLPAFDAINFIAAGGDDGLSLAAGSEVDLGPFPLLTFAPGFPVGRWVVGCRVLDAATGRVLSESPVRFVLSEP